ncbi:MAG: hypothetical protein ACRDD7_15640 [Peptostreptococcaceae bacterium]
MECRLKLSINMELLEVSKDYTVEEVETQVGYKIGSMEHKVDIIRAFKEILENELVGSVVNIDIQVDDVVANDTTTITIGGK